MILWPVRLPAQRSVKNRGSKKHEARKLLWNWKREKGLPKRKRESG